MKKILIALLVIVLLVGGAIYYAFNKPHRDIAGSDADFTVEASVLLKEFETDEISANKKYLDKVISVKGKIAAIETTPEGNISVVLEAGDDISTVTCAMLHEEKDKVLDLKSGYVITIKGMCTGALLDMFKDVVLTQCTMTDYKILLKEPVF